MLNEKSIVKELIQSPVGRDIISRILLQMNNDGKMLNNPFVGNIKLRALPALINGMVDESFIDTLIGFLNTTEQPPHNPRHTMPIEKWWKQAVIYQIYPRSFYDTNGDGIGDLNGITAKLDYLKELGVDVLWLSPVYDSPNVDNGYDIRDYRVILPEFGTMEDFDELLRQTHARGMRLIMDMVLNHTSDEHPWFQRSCNNDPSYKDYYIWRKGKEGMPPNNWTSLFSGSAWTYYSQRDEWALHLFSEKQPDLNWDNPQVREDVYDIVNWWLEKGVDGFRFDVINFISKDSRLPDGNKSIGELMGFCGIEHYFYGPHLHEYLRELRQNTFENSDSFTVGETLGMGIEMSKLLTSEVRKELDTVFCFDQLDCPGKTRFDDYVYDLNNLKKVWMNWQINYDNACWNTLFFENHDNPRMISKVTSNEAESEFVAKLLALLQLTLKGTPFLYQGQELGARNANFSSIDDIRDVESIRLYRELIAKGWSEEKAFTRILVGTRDHARMPMQWDDSPNAGFTSGTPWIKTGSEYKRSAKAQENEGILQFYKRAIALRKQNPALVYGSFTPVYPNVHNYFAYVREKDGQKFFVESNLSNTNMRRPQYVNGCVLLLGSYDRTVQVLRPYEANLYIIK